MNASNENAARYLERIVLTGILLLCAWQMVTLNGLQITVARMDESIKNTASKVELTRLQGEVRGIGAQVSKLTSQPPPVWDTSH